MNERDEDTEIEEALAYFAIVSEDVEPITPEPDVKSEDKTPEKASKPKGRHRK
jgi:hypothetical protein